MPTPQLSSLNPNATLDELKDYLIGLNRYLNYLLSSLDTLNISRLDAKVIIADTITAEKLNVTELSAISANLGHILAGLIEAVDIISGTITGAVIKTASGNARMQLDSSFLTQYDSSNNLMVQLGNGSLPSLALSASGGYIGGTAGLFTSIFGLSIDTTLNTDMPIRINSGSEVITILADRVNITAPGGLWVNGTFIA